MGLPNAHTHCEMAQYDGEGLLNTPPVKLTMTNFKSYKKSSSSWFSVPFYTHRRGYKMCLSVNPNGLADGKGTHLSAIIYLMKGEFDDLLKWPFRGDITVQILDQKSDNHVSGVVSFTELTDRDVSGRVTERERAAYGWGLTRFVALKDLKPFLKSNSLQFMVTKVDKAEYMTRTC